MEQFSTELEVGNLRWRPNLKVIGRHLEFPTSVSVDQRRNQSPLDSWIPKNIRRAVGISFLSCLQTNNYIGTSSLEAAILNILFPVRLFPTSFIIVPMDYSTPETWGNPLEFR